MVLLTIENRIIYETTMEIDTKTTIFEFKHMIKEIGTFKFKVETYPFTYRGLDEVHDLEITVHRNSELRNVSHNNI